MSRFACALQKSRYSRRLNFHWLAEKAVKASRCEEMEAAVVFWVCLLLEKVVTRTCSLGVWKVAYV